MKRVDLEIAGRKSAGKGVARKLRRQGRLPGVLYHQGSAVSVSVDFELMTRLLQTSAGEHALFNLAVTGEGFKRSCVAIVRDYQRDPVTNRLVHVDFFEISMDKSLRLTVPILVVGGVPVGVKEGGVLQHHLRDIEIECLPAAIPEDVRLDAYALQINQALHIRDIVVDSGVRLLADPEQVVVSVAAPISEEKLEEMLIATTKAVEPELIKKERKEEAVEGEGEVKPAVAEKEGQEPKEEKK